VALEEVLGAALDVDEQAEVGAVDGDVGEVAARGRRRR
jgi:hypothetical protein